MTGPRERHQPYEELISASLAGDLTADERRRLDSHLDGCQACRATLAAFSDQRRIMGGLRHVAPPRDLGARVRTGIEHGRFASLPWWRRPPVLVAGVGGGLAAVAGALLAIVLLGNPSPPVGEATPTPLATSLASITPSPSASFPSGPTPVPASATPLASPSEPVATPTPAPASPEPDVYLAHTGPFDNRALTVRDGETGEGVAEVDTPPGPPVAAELSPDGQWIAYITRVGDKGTHEVRATRIGEAVASDDPDGPPPIDSPIEVGETITLGESQSNDPFLERLFWASPRGGYLAYTLADVDSGETDVWLFEPSTGEARRLTDTGSAYAGSWIPDGGAGSSRLWVSAASQQPVSYLLELQDDAGGTGEPSDPAEIATATAEGVFQPLLSPNGRFAIYWNGAMDRGGDTWQFASGAQPYLAEHRAESDQAGFTGERPVFSDLTVGREAFTSASITWGPDSDAYAVWDVRWTGTPQSGGGEDPYPDERRVYFGHATDPRRLTRFHAIDRGDIPEASSVVDVKVSPTGEHLVITAARPVGGTLEAPSADLLLIERNTGTEEDQVFEIRSADDGFWWGPAAFDGE